MRHLRRDITRGSERREGAAYLEPVRADLNREDLIASVERGDPAVERRFGFPRCVQDRYRAAVSARPVDLPPDRPLGRGEVDDPRSVRADQVGVEATLRVGVVDHRLTKRVEVLGEDGVTTCHRRVANRENTARS